MSKFLLLHSTFLVRYSAVLSVFKEMVHSKKLVARYRELKQEARDCILLMQVGAFMQVMNEDARAVSAVTGLKLQMAGEVDDPVVVGGFPKSGLDQYVGKLARAGHSVAIALQDNEKQRSIVETIRLAPDNTTVEAGATTKKYSRQ